MAMINCSIPDDTLRRLREIAAELGRSPEDLAECAIENSVIDYSIRRPIRDPRTGEPV